MHNLEFRVEVWVHGLGFMVHGLQLGLEREREREREREEGVPSGAPHTPWCCMKPMGVGLVQASGFSA